MSFLMTTAIRIFEDAAVLANSSYEAGRVVGRILLVAIVVLIIYKFLSR